MESPFPEPVPDGTRLIETFGWSPEVGVRRLERHLARMGRSAAVFGFPLDEDAARGRLAALSGTAPLRCRLTLAQNGALDLTTAPLAPAPDRPWRVAIHPRTLRSDDPWLAHKTTQRALYDAARTDLPVGVDEWLFLNERGEICEGTITNLFVSLTDGRRLTPPRSAGLLPGILREELLETGQILEARVTLAMLAEADKITLGNSLRGEIPSQLAR